AVPGRAPSDAALAFLLVAASTLLHVAYAGAFPLTPQEAYYWQYARHPALSYFDHPPAAAWTIRAFTRFLGDSERAVRLAAASWSAVFCLFFFLAGRRLLGSRGALAAVAVMLVTPFFSLGQTIITPDDPLVAGWIAAFYFTVRALQDERPVWLLAAGAATGVAALGKYTGFLLLPQILAALLLDPRGRRMLAGPWPWLGAVLSLVLFSPVVIWNATHGWASFGFQFGKRGHDMHLEPVLVGRFFGLQSLAVSPILFLVLLAAMVVAARRWRDETMRLCALFSVPMMAIWTVVSPFHWVKMNWAVPVYPTATLAAVALYAARPARWRALAIAALSLAVLSTAFLTLMPVAPWLPFPARDDTTAGWKPLAARVEAIQREAGPLPVVGCFYRTASTLAFNLPGRPETFSSNAFGEPGLAYDFWRDPRELIGRDVLLVLDDRDAGWCLPRTERCAPLVPLEPLEVLRGGNRVTTFRFWRCGYLGPPDRPRG
ncbi:MAG: glycosyltransferase family 39 protein, partial [Deltaproteobacteria bacterium]